MMIAKAVLSGLERLMFISRCPPRLSPSSQEVSASVSWRLMIVESLTCS